eukprot:jgi/Pico_ML_1/53019/g3641.t1
MADWRTTWTSEPPLLACCVSLMGLALALETHLSWRQRNVLEKARKDPGGEAYERLGKEKYVEAVLYAKEKCTFGAISNLVEGAISAATLLTFALPRLWTATGAICGTLVDCREERFATDALRSIAFAIAWTLTSQVMDLPFKAYSTFVIEAKHGFNTTTPKVFVKDAITSALLACVAAPPLVAGAVAILRNTGPYAAMYLWAFLATFSVLVAVIYPTLIMPLFNKFDPLPDGKLKTKIEELAGKLGFPLQKLYIMDGSKRSGHSNAFMYGFFKNKRIVLFDTLLNQCEEEEVVGVLAHELGHWKLKHTMALFISAMTVLFVQMSAFTCIRTSEVLYRSFGFETQPVFISLILFQLLIAPVDLIITLAQHFVSRLFEFQADAFAIGLGHGKPLRTALLKLEKENKASPVVDPWYSAYHYTHPPLTERLAAIDARLKREE